MKNKVVLIGGIIGFIIPWLMFLIAYMDCSINQQTDCGFALGILFGLAIFFSLGGLIFGIIMGVLISLRIQKTRKKWKR